MGAMQTAFQRAKRAILARTGTTRRFAEDQSGTAVEFALVAMPFFLLLFTIFEIGLIFFKGEFLQSAVSDASRSIYTGQAQQSALSQEQFRQKVCAAASIMFDCGGIHVDVRTFNTLGAAAPFNPVSGGAVNTATSYNPGTRMSIVVVTAFYQQTTWVTLFAPGITGLGNGMRLLQGTAVFRNEPF